MWKWLTKLWHTKPSACNLCSAGMKEKYCTNSDCYHHNHLQRCDIQGDCACPVLDAIVEPDKLHQLAHAIS